MHCYGSNIVDCTGTRGSVLVRHQSYAVVNISVTTDSAWAVGRVARGKGAARACERRFNDAGRIGGYRVLKLDRLRQVNHGSRAATGRADYTVQHCARSRQGVPGATRTDSCLWAGEGAGNDCVGSRIDVSVRTYAAVIRLRGHRSARGGAGIVTIDGSASRPID